jgi:putative intracellular protease/amidase
MKIAILIYNGMTFLDAIGPYEVLSQFPDAEVKLVAKKRGQIKADTGFAFLKAKYNFNDVKEAGILVIPGATTAFLQVMKDQKTLNWIKEIDKTTAYTTTVCSGSIILASTGLLNGLKATSHWKAINLLKEYQAIPTRERIIKEGKYITSAGVSAGIDMALYLCDELFGEDQTKAIQLMLEYDPKPIYDSGNFITCEPEIIELASKKLKKNAKKEMSLLQLFKNRKVIKKMKN